MKVEKLVVPEELLRKARQLEETALAALTKSCYPFVFRYFYYRSITRSDAEDLTSEVFVRVVTSIRCQKGYFPAWLFSITKNLLIDYYRKRGRSRETHLGHAEELFSDSDENKADVLQSKLIKNSLNFLTDEQKEVVTLKFFEGYDNQEIATIMNKSVGAIKTLQFRALSALRGILEKEE